MANKKLILILVENVVAILCAYQTTLLVVSRSVRLVIHE